MDNSWNERVVTLTKTGVKLQAVGLDNNEVHTTKYTFLTAAPKILLEQLQRGVNLYFLGSCALMSIGHNTDLYVGTIKAYSTLAVLLLMMSISALVSLLDDWKRGQADKAMNIQKTTVIDLNTGRDVTTSWKDVKVGDVVEIREGEEIAADSIALCCSSPEGYSYVSTSSLDGETSLKLQICASTTLKLVQQNSSFRDVLASSLETGELSVTTEPPSASIHTFKGMMLRQGEEEEPLDKSQFLLRGSKLQNTEWCVALVIYTGLDTRIMKNTSKTPSKLSHLESVNNQAMLVTAMMQAIISLISDIMHALTESSFLKYWYIYPNGEPEYIILPSVVAWWFSFFTLYSNMVPVSLYSTMEIVNSFQARSIQMDDEMKSGDGKDATFAAVRSTNLCQELGQVTHIFSDKTGTLTKNKMTARAFCVVDAASGEPCVYDLLVESSGRSLAFDAQPGRKAANLLEVLSVAHTVMVVKDARGNSQYMSESPDESALVEAAKAYGWELQDRKGAEVAVVVGMQGMVYHIAAVNSFTSKRSRMSVLVESGGQFQLFVKGADTVMLARKKIDQRTCGMEAELERFAKQGLRTLLVGTRIVTSSERDAFLKMYNAAQLSMDNREEALERAAEFVEKDLEIIGVTAIEDELQDDVGPTISKLRRAGIRLWVLTGDKLETARTIGFSSQVFDTSMEIKMITDEARSIDIHGTLEDIIKFRESELESSRLRQDYVMREVGMMLTGKAITEIMSSLPLIDKFLAASHTCSVVIACRVSPRQKAELVSIVRWQKPKKGEAKPKRVTLAIGDGANDVPMIQAAQIGVGIYGREGHQAVNFADFALGEFQFLKRLVLVQGRWNYRRTCKFVLFTFWRCAVQVLLCFYFTFCCGFSATILFHDSIRLSFNIVLAPVICAVGVFDRDVAAKFVLDRPRLYAPGQQDADLNAWIMFQQLLSAGAHSIFIWSIMYCAFPGLDLKQSGDLYTFGTAVWTVLILDCQIRGMFLTTTWTVWNFLAVASSSVTYLYMLFVFSKSKATMLHGTYGYVLFSSVIFYVAAFSASAMGLAFDFFVEGLIMKYWPDDLNDALMKVLREQRERGEKEISPDFKLASWPAKPLPSGHHIYVSKFGFLRRTEMRHLQLFHTDKSGFRLSILISCALLVLGVYWLYLARAVAREVSLAYSDLCARGQTCSLSVEVLKAMSAPITVSYQLDSFFQNYLTYAQSYSMTQLRGLEATEKDLLNCKMSPTTLHDSRTGKKIVPCGLVAASVFNDTFKFTDPMSDIRSTGIARVEDVTSVFNNPRDYGKNENTIWLYERYPSEVISKDDGVKSEHFAVWNRVSAMAHARKPLGYVDRDLTKGQKLTIEIADNFEPGPNAKKSLILTSVTKFGGTDERLGWLLVVMGTLCFVFACHGNRAAQDAREQTGEGATLLQASNVGQGTHVSVSSSTTTDVELQSIKRRNKNQSDSENDNKNR